MSSDAPSAHEALKTCLEHAVGILSDVLAQARVPSRQDSVPSREDVDAAYHNVLRELLETLKCHAGCIVFLAHREQDFESIIAHGYGENFKWWRQVRFGEGIVSQVANSGESVFTPSVASSKQYKPSNPETASQLTIPLKEVLGSNRGDVFAVVALEWPAQPSNISIELQEELRERLSELLSHFRAVMFTARMQWVFSRLNEISQQETESQCLDLVMATAASLVGQGEVAILQRHGGKLRVRQKQNLQNPPEDLTIGISPGAGYTCYVAHTRKPFYCKDTTNEERYPYYREVDPDTQSQYTAPLLFNKDLVGVLNIGSRQPYGFSKMDRDLIDLLAEHAANALYYSRLVLDLRTIASGAEAALQFVDFRLPSLTRNLRIGKDFDQLTHLQFSVNKAKSLVHQGASQFGLVPTEPVLVVPLVREIVSSFGAAIAFELGKGVDETLEYSIARIHLCDVLWSLISNAIIAASKVKTPHIRVVIEVEELEVKEQHGARYLCISVIDNGPGLDNTQSVYDLFKPHFSREKEGSDEDRHMSLWVCDRVLGFYGGYLDLATSPEKGTRARFWLKNG